MSNAVKAKSWLPNLRLAYTLTGAPAPIEWETVASGESIVEGGAVTKSFGEISAATATSGSLYGVALAAGEEGDEIPVAVGDRNTVFMGQCDEAIGSNTFPKEADIVITSDEFFVDIGKTTEGVLQAIGAVPGDDTSDGDDPGRVFFVIKRSQYDTLVAAK